ncbi:MAG: hypothetical protein JXR73_20930 [Candidatus Omnitrophica bacterium]|nr:hypothetical protein [Candidatus Omnitrophota bacterium]
MKLRTLRIPFVGVAFLVCFIATAKSEESRHSVLSTTPSYAALFKNGVGLVMSKVEMPDSEGDYQIAPLPDATLGSFWIQWGDGLQLKNIKATQIETKESVKAANLSDILEANIGGDVILKVRDREETLSCKILDIPRRHDDPIIQPRPQNVIPIIPPNERGDIVIVESQTRKYAFPLHSILWIDHIKKDSIERSKFENVVQFEAVKGEEGQAADVSLTYLAKGIAWSPSYVLDISREDKAVITAKAVIVNDLQPLEHTNLELIAGYPNIAFSEANSAFSLTPLNQILERIRERGRMREEMMLSNMAVLSQRAYYDASARPGTPSAPATPVMGETAEDLYFYQIGDVTLKKGERGYYPLFSQEIPYEHIYTWEISQFIDENAAYRGRQDETPVIQEVWHALKLTNTTNQPWTSAPATTMKDGRILGQDTILFTPGGAETELKITQAVSIDAEHNEYEIERQRSAAQFYGRNYDLVKVRGELAVTNFKDKEVDIEITKTLSGEVKDYSLEPKVVQLARGLNSVNPESQLVWNVKVKPGKENAVKLTYTYQIWIRG